MSDGALRDQLSAHADTPEEEAAVGSILNAFKENDGFQQLISGIFSGSPFLATLIEHAPARAWACFNQDPDRHLVELADGLWPNLAEIENEADAMAYLRRSREEAALLIGLSDLAGRWQVMRVCEALTQFADAAVHAAVRWLLRAAERKGDILPRQADDPAIGCGYCVLALGKLGAGELNYSSDVDLIVLYDPETAPVNDGVEPATFFVRLTRALVKLLQEQTAEGYVYRVDLRLRPDPGATAVAISLEAAGQYYESLGQNWERAAMIKARCIAGDTLVAEAFLQRLTPFIWRKNLDYAAIADVHSMKRQIHSHKGHGEIAVAGHNIKLGRGGIREVEFFAQTQQLIAGGRVLQLRTQKTLDTLAMLADQKWIGAETEAELRESYLFLRQVENRLQMREDQQIHTLPEDADDLANFAQFADFSDFDAFSAKLTAHLIAVQGHYAELFEDAPDLGGETGSLVFTGGEDDPDTLDTLAAMGFKRCSEISSAVRAWHFGRFPATRSGRSREILTELMPHLLKALSQTADPDAAFRHFDQFLRQLPAGVQLFSMLRANTKLLDLIAIIMGTAPRLAAFLGQQVGVLDAVISEDFFSGERERSELDAEITGRFDAAAIYEEKLDLARIIAHEEKFRIGVQLVSGTLDPQKAGMAYATLADSLIAGLLSAVEKEIILKHGRVDGARIAIIAMGKLGGREMTAASDLDLMVIYDFDGRADKSDGERPLDPVTYFTRLTQRLISALSVPTAEGALYEVDMRLRPSGRSGPIATHIASFREYHENSAWTWEHMALTRARVIAGDRQLTDAIEGVVSQALGKSRPHEQLVGDARDMRTKIEEEKKAASSLDLKLARGGLLDIEFIAQYLQLAHGADHADIFDQNTHEALRKLKKGGILSSEDAATLMQAHTINTAIAQITKLCLEDDTNIDAVPNDLKKLLSAALNLPDFDRLTAVLTDSQKDVKVIFNQMFK